MCGIAGFFTTAPSADALPRLVAQTDALAHRGPDGRGLYLAGPRGVHLERVAYRPGRPPRPLPPPDHSLGSPPPGVEVGLGIRQLQIVDRDGGNAPVFDHRGDVAVVFNGEIYNHAALREELVAQGYPFATRGDTEVLAQLYRAAGMEGVLARIRGQFAIALWDARIGRLFLARDPLGIKPLHHALQAVPGGMRLWFASEPRGILADGAFHRALEPGGLARYLLQEAPLAPVTFFQDLALLLPGTYLEIGGAPGGAITILRRAFWRIPDPVADRRRDLPGSLDVAGWKREIGGALERAVVARLPQEVRVTALLSGGIDSGLVAAALSRAVGDLQTFSVGFSDPDFDEAPLAAETARHLGVRHEVIPLSEADFEPLADAVGHHQDQPLGDHSLLPTFALSRAVRQAGFTVALSGDGGDELFAGYPTYLADRWSGALDAVPRPALRGLLAALGHLPAVGGNFSADVKARLLLEGALAGERARRQARWMGAQGEAEMRALLTPEVRRALDASPLGDPFAEIDAHRRLHRRRAPLLAAQLQDLRFYMQDVVLAKVDRASMAHAIEVRVPMLDREVVERALALPSALKLRGLSTKWILRELAREQLPPQVARGPKRGFGLPTSRWLRRLGADRLSAWLAPPPGAAPLLDAHALARLAREHADGHRDHRRVLWSVIALRRWQAGPWSAALL